MKHKHTVGRLATGGLRRLKRDSAPPATGETTGVAPAGQAAAVPEGEIHAFILDSPRRDQHGLRVMKWDLSDFNNGADGGGKVLYMHRDGSWWSGEGAPIARGVARMEGENLVLSITRYDDADRSGVAQEVRRQVDEGFLDCASARFDFDWDALVERPDGYDVPEARLIEASIVVLPGHADSLRIRSGGGVKRTMSDEETASEDVACATLTQLRGPGCWVPLEATAAVAAAYARACSAEAPTEVAEEKTDTSAVSPEPDGRSAAAAPSSFDADKLARAMAESFDAKEM